MLNIAARFIESALLQPDAFALEVNNSKYTYRELADLSTKLATVIASSTKQHFVGLLSYRSISTYTGILGILLSGKCYVPLSPKFPFERIINILKIIECDLIIIDSKFQTYIPTLVETLDKNITFVALDKIDEVLSTKGKCHFVTEKMIKKSDDVIQFENEVNPETEAYLLFTSGSTGEPKGIPVNHGNLNAYLDNVLPKYNITPKDRVSQSFDTTFDPSFHDMFIAWSNAATLVVVPEEQLMTPHRFICEKQITVWASVPSIGRFLSRIKALKPNIFHDLKYTLFTGEALPYEVYAEWKNAAPNSHIINGYGPTELTMNIADFWIPENLSIQDCFNGIVPIGRIFPDHSYLLENGNTISKNKGELLVSGPQQVQGYFKDAKITEDSFVIIDNKRYYRTGDRVKMGNFGLNYIGRIDSQLQIRGFRVELNEIEYFLKQLGLVEVAAIGFPESNGVADGIVVFIIKQKIDESVILNHCIKYLPEYMVPSKILFIESIPLNDNGKVDKLELKRLLNENEKH